MTPWDGVPQEGRAPRGTDPRAALLESSGNAAFAGRLAATLPRRPRLLGLGAESGRLLRALGPRIGRAQVWTIVDADADALDDAAAAIADAADARGWTVTFAARAVLVHAPGGAWRVETVAADPFDPPPALRGGADAIFCEGLLPAASAAWLAAFAGALDVPFLAGPCPDGRDRILPRHPADALVLRTARRASPAGTLGVRAVPAAMRAFAAAGHAAWSAPADLRLRRATPDAAATILDPLATAASLVLPARRAVIADWQAMRMHQARAGRLALDIGHRDMLVLPAGARSDG